MTAPQSQPGTAVLLWLVLIGPAAAQDWSHGACYESGIYFPAREFGQCVSADKGAFAQTFPPANLQGVISGGTVSIATTAISNATTKCPADREVVMTSTGAYKCAKDLTEPQP